MTERRKPPTSRLPSFEPRPAGPESHWQGFQDLVRNKVHDVLLLASPYESFILAEDGQPHALMLREFLDLNVRHIPGFRHVTTAREALDIIRRQPSYNLVIASVHVGDMSAAQFAQKLRAGGSGVAVVLLAYDGRDLEEFRRRYDMSLIERAFLWQGDASIFPAIVQHVEDRLNVEHDTGTMGVQAILLIEDSVRYYSSFLPVVYAEVIEHSRRLVPEGLNLAHRLLRFQARPKILLCTTFEEAERAFTAYRENVLGVISDVEFPKRGRPCPDAGVQFARMVQEQQHDVPIILHSQSAEHRAEAEAIGARFLRKGSPLLLEELRRFMIEFFGFGDFVFLLPGGAEVDRAHDLRTLEKKLHTVPAESIAYHAARNHFSRWLKARTEFAVAQRLRPRKVSDFPNLEALREDLIRSIQEYRQSRSRATVSDFRSETFDANWSFARIGGGSLGGKARGLAFVNQLLSERDLRDRFPGVRIHVPPSLVLASEVFDQFVQSNHLLDFAIESKDDDEIRRRFLEADFPAAVERDLADYLKVVREPLAVRSSSLLEDSQFLPFAGIYDTHMIANDHTDLEVRLKRLVRMVKLVYASTFWRRAKSYLEATAYRLEEEKMAVVLQRLVGSAHGRRFYPTFAGVARSHNFYPIAPMRASDGIAAVALGFGAAVVEGEVCFRFCPRYPQKVVQFSSVKDILRNSQRSFHALQLAGEDELSREAFDLRQWGLEAAEEDGTLDAIGSTYSPENYAIYDGIARPGVRLVSFAGVLKHDAFPLAEILELLLEAGSEGMGTAVEIEFAVNLSPPRGAPRDFGFLQLRPLALSRELADLDLGPGDDNRALCRSSAVLGHGRLEDIRDLVVVDLHRFDRGRSQDVAAEVARFNAHLFEHHVPYLLIGVGRWGSSEPLLGIPVSWDQIAGARVIVETGFKDFKVTPSQGSHFFQNLVAAHTGYFTVNPEAGEGFLDWDWLGEQAAVAESRFVRHLHLAAPLTVIMNGRKSEGVILKPPGV